MTDLNSGCRLRQLLNNKNFFQLTPLDGGVDNGLTFSSPDWLTVPPEEIRPITSQSPSHPASSFYYPDLEALPHIAQFTFRKV